MKADLLKYLIIYLDLWFRKVILVAVLRVDIGVKSETKSTLRVV